MNDNVNPKFESIEALERADRFLWTGCVFASPKDAYQKDLSYRAAHGRLLAALNELSDDEVEAYRAWRRDHG